MKQVTVNMQNVLMGQFVEQSLKQSGEFYTAVVGRPEDVAKSCELSHPDILLMEVTGYTPWKLCERLKIRDQVKTCCPNCKIVLLVDENVEMEVAEQVKQAKRDGCIDQFIYGSTGASYLVALLETM